MDESVLLQIVQKFVDEVRVALSEKQVELIVSLDALKWLGKKGYDKVYGARPIARTVEEHIKKALVDELLFGRISNGGKVQVDLDKDKLRFQFSTNTSNPQDHKKPKETVTT